MHSFKKIQSHNKGEQIMQTLKIKPFINHQLFQNRAHPPRAIQNSLATLPPPITLKEKVPFKKPGTPSSMKVNFHYKRFGNDYNGWNLWYWEDGKNGQSVNFSETGPFGKTATVELNGESNHLNFMLRKNNWQERDISFNRKIALDPDTQQKCSDVYLVQNEPSIFYHTREIPKQYKMENYFGNDLGMQFQKDLIHFRVWAPTADHASINLYKEDLGGKPITTIPMKSGQGSTWIAELPKHAEGLYYTYSIDGREAVDPYAHSVGANGMRGQITDLTKTNPKDWHKDASPTLASKTDAVIYEVHPRHFTIDPSSGVSPNHRGKFLGLIETGTKNPHNLSTGIDHLKDLGITHVQIMPSFDFASVDETAKNLDKGNWGYDPLNWNVPEGSYSTNPHKGDVRIREFKQMIKGFHDHGIGVIMDVVYPHTYKREDSHLNQIVPDYYYRRTREGHYANGSGCGNEIASEKPMAKKMIVDSVLHWAKEYHIDGFRFDQMSLIDKDTMIEIRNRLDKEVRPNILIYGEGWDRSHSIPHHYSAHKGNVSSLRGMGFFNNEFSNAIRGDFNGNGDKGLAHGNNAKGDRMTYALKGDTMDVTTPDQSVNYVGCHDNMTFWDNINKNLNGSFEDKIKAYKMGYALTLLSQGIPFISEGDEFIRTKSGRHNTYNAEDFINKVDWHGKTHNKHIHDYLKGLIALRKQHPAFRIKHSGELLNKVYTSHNANNETVKMVIDGYANNDPIRKFEVLTNYGSQYREVYLSEHRKWTVLATENQARTQEIFNFTGDRYIVPPRSLVVVADSESYERMLSLRAKKKNAMPFNFESKSLMSKMLSPKKPQPFISM
jgi:pullulanase